VIPAGVKIWAAAARERDEFKGRAERAEHERSEFKKLYLLVTLELERLKRQLFGKKAETVDPAQVQLAFGPVLEALERARGGGAVEVEAVESELTRLRERAEAEIARRKLEKNPPAPHGRRDLSLEDLPVETIVLEPPERLIAGGDALVKIGEEVAEHIDHRPASLVRVRVVRPKYKVPEPAENSAASASRIVIAPLPERPIPRGIAGPGLLAHVLVSKYADHLPLHRQEKIFRRQGCTCLARRSAALSSARFRCSTGWSRRCGKTREPMRGGSASTPPVSWCWPRTSAATTTSGW